MSHDEEASPSSSSLHSVDVNEGDEKCNKYDDDVMNLEFKKYEGKKKNNKNQNSNGGSKSVPSTALPVNQRGRITKEQMLTAPHSPYFEVRVGQAVFLRQAANDEYANNEIEEAIKLYERALYHCDFSDSKLGFDQTEEQKQSLREATDPVYLNLARCYLKKKEHRKALLNARTSMHEESTALHKIKAHFLEGKALCGLKEYVEAVTVLEKGSQGIKDEFEKEENTNFLQLSILQQDYQALLQVANDGLIRHKAHDLKVWKGVLENDSKENITAEACGNKKNCLPQLMPQGFMWLTIILTILAAILGHWYVSK